MKHKIGIFSLSLTELQTFFKDEGLPKYAADQIFQWVYKKLEIFPENWSNVSKKVKDFLISHCEFSPPKVVHSVLSKDGTRKYLLKMHDGEIVEAVSIPAKNNRLTICLSSQVGCAIGCTFCHTGTMGLKRNLTTHEIVGQFWSLSKFLESDEQRPTNIVFMGQGEPLHNFKEVKKSIEIFMEDKGFGLGQRKITLSTSGLVPQIEKLEDFPPVNIAISLHAAHNEIRSELMPINKTYDLTRLLEAIKKIPLKAHRWITYEYLLIEDLNDRPEDLEALVKLLDKKESKINLIPFNEYPESTFKRPSEEKIQWFQDQLIAKGLICTTRASKGRDILAACGQLKTLNKNI